MLNTIKNKKHEVKSRLSRFYRGSLSGLSGKKNLTLLLPALFLFCSHIKAQSWSELGGLNGLSAGSSIFSVCSDASGDIYAAGWFTNSSGKKYVAKYNGSAWSELGGLNGLAANGEIWSLCIDASGNIYAGGYFTNGPNNTGKYYIAKYDGSAWNELGGLNGLAAIGPIQTVCSDASGNIYAVGAFTNSSGKQYVAKYNGSSWSELGGLNGLAANNLILSVCSDASGNIYAAGGFTNSSGNKYVAKYNGSVWSELGGLNGLAANSGIYSVCSDASGNIYAAGWFTNSSGNWYVAKYNGSAWSELGGLNGLAANGQIYSVYSDASGNIYAAGWFTNSSGKKYVANISVYPNPGTGEFKVSCPDFIGKSLKFKVDRIEIDNVFGKKIYEQTISSDHETLNTKLNSGIYFVKLLAGEKSYCRKIIVE
jgi:Secretion system C-terminal sorting domain/Domain of unknown function (DUF5122) beta-propeller